MKFSASRVLLAIAAICGLLVLAGVNFGDFAELRLIGASLFFGWLGLIVP